MTRIAPAERRSAPPVRATLFRHPLSRLHEHAEFAPGLTIAEMLEASDFPPRVWGWLRVHIGEHEIPRDLWRVVRPKPGAPLVAEIVPRRGGGGILRIVAMIAVIAFAAWVAPTIAGGLGLVGEAGTSAAFVAGSTGAKIVTGLIGGIVTMVGNLVIGALIPPPSPAAPAVSGFGAQSSLSSPTYQITGTQNRLNPYGPIPRVFGERRVFPVLAAKAYSETLGDKRYFRMLLAVGYGPISIDQIRIGNTPIEAFDNVEVEIREGWPTDEPRALFTRRISETQLSVALSQSAGWRTTRTENDAVSASIDIAFERGLAYYNTAGGTDALTVAFEAEYRAAGDTGAWTPIAWDSGSDTGYSTAGIVSISANSTSAVRRGGRFTFPSTGTYDVRLRRTTADSSDSRTINQSTWTALRTIRADAPMNMDGIATLALRIESYEQLNNQLQEITCRARSWHRVWNGAAWAWAMTRLPPWHCVDLLTRRGAKTLLADSRIDAPAFKAWADACMPDGPSGDPKWTFDGVIEGGSVGEAFSTIAAHGRARFGFSPDGKYSIVRDVAQDTPVLHITPRNSFGYRGTRDLRDLPHAVRVRFSDPDIDYQENEVVVYADGYDAATADEFDTLDLYGCTSPDMAWREGRYHLAVAYLRRERHEVFQDIEFLRATDGDLVQFAHDVIAVGLAQGRIVSRIEAGSDTTGFVLDEEMPMEAGKDYALRVRHKDGASQVLALATVAGNSKTVTLAAPLATALAPAPGDLALFGEAGLESMPAIVKGVEPGADLTAKLILIPAAPEVHDADAGDIPPFVSYATPIDRATPRPVGLFLAASTAELRAMADGTIRPRIRVRWNMPSADAVLGGVDIEIQWRPDAAPEAPWGPSVFTSGGSPEYFIEDVIESRPAEGVVSRYEVRLRSVARVSTLKSDWLSDTVEVVGKTALPSDVLGFSAAANGTAAVLRWSPVDDLDLDGYDIRFAPAGVTVWSSATPLSQATGGTSMTTIAVPPGDWNFLIKARDASGNLSANAAIAATSIGAIPVGSTNIVVYTAPQAPDWPGVKTNCHVHWSGVLVPNSTKLAVDVTEAEAAAAFNPGQVAKAVYEAPEIDLGFDARVRSYAATAAQLGAGETAGAAICQLEQDYRLDAGAYDGFEPWTIGTNDLRKAKQRIALRAADGAAVATAFTPTIDAAVRQDEAGIEVAVPSVGLAVAFNRRFFSKPNVQVTPVGGVAQQAWAESVTLTGCVLKCATGAGALTAGSVNYQATGV
ncbi:MAG: host specificity factor TipJ family phage tail protein [Tagaea sp.]|nr:host specificity factor TipJ family phage tail protein [Tagaea sp.]